MPRQQELREQRLNNSERSALALFLSDVAGRFDNRYTKRRQPVSAYEAIEEALSAVAVRGIYSEAAIQGGHFWRRGNSVHLFHRNQQILMSASADERGYGLSLAVETIFFTQYGLDMGVPFAPKDAMPIVFPVRRPGLARQEVLTRAASLAGLVIGPAGAPEQIENFIALEESARYRRLRRSDLAAWLRP
jgi:hypothetical protein